MNAPVRLRIGLAMPACIMLVLVALALGVATPAAAADLAATVLRLQGTAMARSPEGEARALDTGAELYVGEEIRTEADTRLRMRLIDGAVITLGDHSTFTLVGYQPESEGMVLDLIEGVFRAVSGTINEQQARPMTVRTPLGVMGIRGTTFWGRQHEDHLEVALLEGKSVFVESEGVRVVLDEAKEGTDVLPGQPPTPPKPWGQQRLDAAAAMVSFQ